jgi:hypothetical protein
MQFPPTQADWNAESGPASIANKPTLGTAAAHPASDFDAAGAATAVGIAALAEINTEATTRAAADTTINGNVTAEATARAAGDALLMPKDGGIFAGDVTFDGFLNMGETAAIGTVNGSQLIILDASNNINLEADSGEVFFYGDGGVVFGGCDLSGFATMTSAGNAFLVDNDGNIQGLSLYVSSATMPSLYTNSITTVGNLTGANVTLKMKHIGGLTGTGITPTLTAGSGAGTSPTITLVGNDVAGKLTITTGSSPAANAAVATMTYASAYNAAPYPGLTPGNAAAASLAAAAQPYIGSAAGNLTISGGSTALSANTTYVWFYQILGN